MKNLFVSYTTASSSGTAIIELEDSFSIENNESICYLQNQISNAFDYEDVIINNFVWLPI